MNNNYFDDLELKDIKHMLCIEDLFRIAFYTKALYTNEIQLSIESFKKYLDVLGFEYNDESLIDGITSLLVNTKLLYVSYSDGVPYIKLINEKYLSRIIITKNTSLLLMSAKNFERIFFKKKLLLTIGAVKPLKVKVRKV